MVWKCPKCSYRSASYRAVQKHFYKNHYKPVASAIKNKGKEKKVYIFKPKVGRNK